MNPRNLMILSDVQTVYLCVRLSTCLVFLAVHPSIHPASVHLRMPLQESATGPTRRELPMSSCFIRSFGGSSDAETATCERNY